MSEADPYVTLQLPTAPGTKFKTKTITNSSHPVWNETFSFLIQSRVKVKARAALLRTGYLLLLEHIFFQGSVTDTGEVRLRSQSGRAVWEILWAPAAGGESGLWQVAGPR